MQDTHEMPQTELTPPTPEQPVEAALPPVIAVETAGDTIEQQITALNAAPDPTVRNTEPILAGGQGIAQAHIVPLKEKSHKKLITGIVAGAVLLLGGVGGGFYYWQVVRVPDGDYQQAAASIDKLAADMTDIGQNTGDWSLLHTDASKSTVITAGVMKTTLASSTSTSSSSLGGLFGTTAKESTTVQQKLQDFTALLNTLQSSRVFTQDAVVKKAFSDANKKITTYQSQWSDIAGTAVTMYNIHTQCKAAGDQLNTMTTSQIYDKYDTVMQGCTQAVQQNATVPLKEFNDKYYAQYYSDGNKFLSSEHDSIMLEQALNQSFTSDNYYAYAKAMNTVAQVEEDMAQLEQGMASFHTPVPADPSSSLAAVKSTIQNRQKVFLR